MTKLLWTTDTYCTQYGGFVTAELERDDLELTFNVRTEAGQLVSIALTERAKMQLATVLRRETQ